MKTCCIILTICLLSCSFFTTSPFIKNNKNGHIDFISASFTLSNYSVIANDRLNSVKLTIQSHSGQRGDSIKKKRNKIEIKGEQNSVKLTQSGFGAIYRYSRTENKIKSMLPNHVKKQIRKGKIIDPAPQQSLYMCTIYLDNYNY